MSNCDRCKQLERYLTDERKAHVATKDRLKVAQASKKTIKDELKRMQELVNMASSFIGSPAEQLQKAAQLANEEKVSRVMRASATRRKDNGKGK